MLRAVQVYLDIDGVLLGLDPTRPQRLALAPHALDFLAFLLARTTVHWLSPLHHDAKAALDHLVTHTQQSDRERLLTLAPRVRMANWRTLRTEALHADGRFVWLDDAPSPEELASLRQRNWLDRWLWVDTREEPEDLLRAQRVLATRLPLPAAKATGAP